MPAPSPVEVVRLLFEACGVGDVRRVCRLIDPDIHATSSDGRAFRGMDAVRHYFAAQQDGPAREVHAHRIEPDGDGGVIAHGRLRIIDRGSVIDSPASWRFAVRGGLVTAIAPYAAARPLAA